MKAKLVGMTQQLSVLTNFVDLYMSSQHSRQPTNVPPPYATSHTPQEAPSPDVDNPEAATTTPDSDPGLDLHQPHEQNQRAPNLGIPPQPNQRQQKRRVLLPAPSPSSFYPRPSVWLPGYGPSPQPQPQAFWQPRRGRSKSRSKQRGNSSPKEPSVADLIDLN